MEQNPFAIVIYSLIAATNLVFQLGEVSHDTNLMYL